MGRQEVCDVDAVGQVAAPSHELGKHELRADRRLDPGIVLGNLPGDRRRDPESGVRDEQDPELRAAGVGIHGTLIRSRGSVLAIVVRRTRMLKCQRRGRTPPSKTLSSYFRAVFLISCPGQCVCVAWVDKYRPGLPRQGRASCNPDAAKNYGMFVTSCSALVILPGLDPVCAGEAFDL